MARHSRRPEASSAQAGSRGALALHAAPDEGETETRTLTRLAWLVAAILGAALLLVAFRFHPVGDYGAETDFYGGYAAGAAALQRGHLDPARYGVVGPGYEVALALVGLVVRDLFRAAELISTLATAAMLLFWFHLLLRRTSARLGLFAALFLATNAQLFRFGYSATTDALALALQSAALFALLARSGVRSAAVAGLLAAAAFLTRYNAIVLVPLGLVAAALGGRDVAGPAAPQASTPDAAGGSGLAARRDRVREALTFLAAFAIPVGAWLAFCLAHGVTFASQLHHNLAYEVFARSRGIAWDAYQRDLQPTFHSLADVIARDPGAVAARLVANCGEHLVQDARLLLGWPVAICVALGLVFAIAGAGIRRQWPLVLGWALSFLALVPVFYSERYALTLLPWYAAAAAAAFASPRFALVLARPPRYLSGARWRGLRLKTVLAAVPLGLSLAGSVEVQRRVLADQPGEVLEAAETLRALRRPGDRLIARKPHLAWLAGVEAVPFPFAQSLEGLATVAHREHARWLLYSSPEAGERPWYRHLLDTSAVVPGLTPRRVARTHPAVLYEIGPEFGTRPAWAGDSVLVMLYTARARLLDHPDDVNLLGLAGSIELERGMLAPARRHLEHAADLAPDDPRILVTLGETLLRSGEYRLAGLAYQRAEQSSPGSLEARTGRGWATLLAGDARAAAELWRPVIGATRERPTLEKMLEIYRSLGDTAAVAEVERARRRVGAPAGSGR